MTTSEYIAVFGIMIGMFGAVLGAWINVRVKMAEQAIELKNLKEHHASFDDTIKSIFLEIKSINEKLHEKADRS